LWIQYLLALLEELWIRVLLIFAEVARFLECTGMGLQKSIAIENILLAPLAENSRAPQRLGAS
jgi:hypothetical protein